MDNNSDLIIGKYKITRINITESWKHNRMVYGECDESRVMEYSVSTSEKWLDGGIIIFKRYLFLEKMPDGKIAPSQNDYCYSVIHSNFPMNDGFYCEYGTIGIYTGKEDDLIDFFKKKLAAKRAEDIERYNQYAKEEYEKRQQDKLKKTM
jgi:hypothetical protein